LGTTEIRCGYSTETLLTSGIPDLHKEGNAGERLAVKAGQVRKATKPEVLFFFRLTEYFLS
jgi:hypothetical protein